MKTLIITSVILSALVSASAQTTTAPSAPASRPPTANTRPPTGNTAPPAVNTPPPAVNSPPAGVNTPPPAGATAPPIPGAPPVVNTPPPGTAIPVAPAVGNNQNIQPGVNQNIQGGFQQPLNQQPNLNGSQVSTNPVNPYGQPLYNNGYNSKFRGGFTNRPGNNFGLRTNLPVNSYPTNLPVQPKIQQ